MRGKRMFVYILSSLSRTLYVGVTSNLVRRLHQHRSSVPGSFATRYRVTRLVHYEVMFGSLNAIRREKQIKAWRREKKIALIELANAGWLDLAGTLFSPLGIASRRSDSSGAARRRSDCRTATSPLTAPGA